MSRFKTREQELEEQYPDIKWREPVILVGIHTGTQRFGCRFCIAMHGLKAGELFKLPLVAEAIERHIEKEHPP